MLYLDLTLGTVINFVTDFFLARQTDCIKSADDDEASTIASAQTVRDARVNAERVWAVPDSVPVNLTVPIAIAELSIEPNRGEFDRFSKDLVACGMWLAIYWAKIDAAAAGSAMGADTAAGLAVDSPLFKLERLIVDWPFDLHFRAGGRQDSERANCDCQR